MEIPLVSLLLMALTLGCDVEHDDKQSVPADNDADIDADTDSDKDRKH